MNERELWYFEYRIVQDRAGLLGDVATLFGMLGINIQTVNSLNGGRRSFLLMATEEQTKQLQMALANFQAIAVTAIHRPTLLDYIALRHGKSVEALPTRPPVYRFLREDLEMMIDFLASHLAQDNPITVGLRGSPNVGKTEATIAACVHANKRWVVVSGTIMRQVIRTELDQEERSSQAVLLIDAITSVSRPIPGHRRLLDELAQMPVSKVIEHPDIFIREGIVSLDELDLIIEVRNHTEDVIKYDLIPMSCNSFDCS